MGLNQSVKRIYLSIGYGKLRIKCEPTTPGAVRRENEKGTFYAIEYSSIDGILEGISFKEDPEFGNEWRIAVRDGSDNFVIQVKENSQYCRDLLKKLPNLRKGNIYKFTPYDFEDVKANKRRMGLSIKDDADAKIGSYYQRYSEGKEYPDNINGFPDYTCKWTDKDEVKIYGLRVTSFLRKESLAFLSGEFIKNAIESQTGARSGLHSEEDSGFVEPGEDNFDGRI